MISVKMKYSRSCRIRSHLANARDVLEHPCVGDALGELLAQGLQTVFRGSHVSVDVVSVSAEQTCIHGSSVSTTKQQ